MGEYDLEEERVERMGPAAALRRTMDRASRGRGPHPSRGLREKALRDHGRQPCSASGARSTPGHDP